MNRIIKPELLDALPPEHPQAIRSRRDLRRVNAWMRNGAVMAEALQRERVGQPPRQMVELGAGDGCFLLGVARTLAPGWPGVRATLIDRQKIVSGETLAEFARLGWTAEVVVSDVFDWSPASVDVVIANLFLHHFENAELARLLRTISERASLFVAVEPRRSAWSLFWSRCLWAIGCNSVTRHDAVISVRAGFSGRELSALWPDAANWRLTEHAAGPFSHLFIARKKT